MSLAVSADPSVKDNMETIGKAFVDVGENF